MANTLQLKNSTTTAAVPATLEQGEVAINIADKKAWVGDAAKAPQLLISGTTVTHYLGTVTGTTLTKTSGDLTVARVGVGIYDVTISATAGLIVNLPDWHQWGEVSGTPGNRRIQIRDSEKLGQPLADPATLLIVGVA